MSMRVILEQVRAKSWQKAYGVDVPDDFAFRSGSDPRIVGKFNTEILDLAQKMANELAPHSDETVATQRQMIYKKYGRQAKDIMSNYPDYISNRTLDSVNLFISKVASSIVFGDSMEYEIILDRL